MPGWREGSVVVTELQGHTIAISELPVARITDWASTLEDYGPPGPLVDGQPTRMGEGRSTLRGRALLLVRGDLAVEVSSRTADLDTLAAAAADVSVPTTAAGAVPGQLVGILEAGPDVALASYAVANQPGWDPLYVFTATPDQQRALLALAHADGSSLAQMETEASCCAPDLLRPSRVVRVSDVDATISTFTSASKILVVPGDPGIVVLTQGVRSYDNVPSDELLIAVAEGSLPSSQDDLVAHVRAVERAEDERVTALLREQEAARGWEVVEELVVEGTPVLISAGMTARHLGDPEPASAQMCAVFGELSGSSPPTMCVEASPPADLLVAAPGDAGMNGFSFGTAGRGVESVRLEVAEEAIEAELVAVGAAQVFVLVGDHLGLLQRSGLGVSTESMARIAFVARDADGAELARVPLFPHLQPG